jgi:hypothetical protein
MYKYIRCSKKYVKSPIDRIKSALGISDWSNRSDTLYKCDDGRHNFYISSYYRDFSDDDITTYKQRIKTLGGKYIKVYKDKIYFYLDMSNLEDAYRQESEEAEAQYNDELNAMDIDQYKPTSAIIKKLVDYRNRGSKVNVKAIKDLNKLLTYYYGACLIGWDALAGDCSDVIGWEYKDLLTAIDRRVQSDPQYKDNRTEMEQRLDIPSSKDLFTFESKDCWVPKKLLQFFIDNNIKVHFKKRTPGYMFDRNGRQWTEIEHLQIYKDDNNVINYDLAVHTDEGGGANTYTGNHTSERTSIKNIIEDIKRSLNI